MAQKTIIANMGEGDVGKTESIIMVYEKLKEVADSEKDQAGTKPSEKDQVKQKDICEVVTINGLKVGIASDGDTQEIVRRNLNELVRKDCQIILTACRSNHDFVCLLNEYTDKNNKDINYRIWRTSNARIYESGTNPRVAPKGMLSRFNEQWATEIANMIESWCYAGEEISSQSE